MKKMFIILLCFACYYCNGQEASDDTLNRRDLNGKKTGKWIGRWTETNKLASIEYFVAGKRNGLCTYYNMKGYIVENRNT